MIPIGNKNITFDTKGMEIEFDNTCVYFTIEEIKQIERAFNFYAMELHSRGLLQKPMPRFTGGAGVI